MCISYDPERECEDARASKANRFAIFEEKPTDWGKIIMFVIGLLTVLSCLFCIVLGQCLKKKRDRNKWVEEGKRTSEYYDAHDGKYWDSVLPPEREGDGKYAHLILDRDGTVLGVKPGFNEDGTRIGDTKP